MLCLLQVIAPAALFLAAKVEEQPRKLEHVIKVAHACLNPQEPSPDVRSDVSVQLCVLLVLLSTIISVRLRSHQIWRCDSNAAFPIELSAPGPGLGHAPSPTNTHTEDDLV